MAKTAKRAKTSKTSAKISRCRVCHREMTDAAHIAAGIGPICAAKALRASAIAASRASSIASDRAARIARIERNVRNLARALYDADEYRQVARNIGTPKQRARGEWDYSLVKLEYERWRRIQAHVARVAR